MWHGEITDELAPGNVWAELSVAKVNDGNKLLCSTM